MPKGNGAGKRAHLPDEYTVDRVLAEWHSSRGRELCVRWKGYNFLGDTWEPEEQVQPASKVQKFDAGIPLTIDLQWAVSRFRRALMDRMTSPKISERGAVHHARLSVPALENPTIARALIQHTCGLTRPALRTEEEPSGALSVEIWALDHISDVVALHVHEKAVGYGNLRIKCGRASYEDMMMVIPPLKLIAGASGGFTAELDLITFHGKTGQPRWPKIMKETEQHTTAERNAMVDHAKSILKQTWSTYPIQHHLKQHGWHRLASHVWALPTAVGMEGPST